MLSANALSKFMADKIKIEKVSGQSIQELYVSMGTTLGEILGDIKPAAAGVFGKIRSMDYTLQAGDRIEIYQHLFMDPKEARRVRAKAFKK